MQDEAKRVLDRGAVIPACPLALDARRRWDEGRQRALIRYYCDAGAGGLAVGVHTTQFAIRDPQHALFKPLLALAAAELRSAAAGRTEPIVAIAGVCGPAAQAIAEAEYARDCGYDAALVSLAALKEAGEEELVAHCRRIAEVLPLVGFYLQPSVGGRLLPYAFWRRFAEIENVAAIKIAPFNRYQTLDVVRAVIEAGRDDIALYPGNDDNIVADLLTPFAFEMNGRRRERRFVGGLLGQWAVGTRQAVR
ncbi:MAG TPA: dihydrodipicolinate synthase family protein, partial [Thermomicrobiales bacterium]|nr:dihydrodipicolinate synthase family protein [Thermomicrobiales bacterium]